MCWGLPLAFSQHQCGRVGSSRSSLPKHTTTGWWSGCRQRTHAPEEHGPLLPWLPHKPARSRHRRRRWASPAPRVLRAGWGRRADSPESLTGPATACVALGGGHALTTPARSRLPQRSTKTDAALHTASPLAESLLGPSLGRPTHLRWGWIANSTPLACSRLARSWKASTDKAAPKWGTGTGSPSTCRAVRPRWGGSVGAGCCRAGRNGLWARWGGSVGAGCCRAGRKRHCWAAALRRHLVG